VAVEKQDGGATPAAPSDHPASVAPEVLQAALGSLQVRVQGSEQNVPLFAEGEAELIATAASKGLALARPDEDVTFAVVGLHPALLGLMKRPLVTTGRLFVRHEQLNLILGTVHEEVKESDDRRLNPFVPGSRKVTTRAGWRVTTKAGEIVQVAADRPDWLVLPLVAAAPPAQVEIPREMKPGPGAGPAAAPPRPAGKSVEERLMILNDLRKKGLITDEEYRTKRLQIMNEF
jgi:hypothetical protein